MYEQLLEKTRLNFEDAVASMLEETQPFTPIPKPRVFMITPEVTWPCISSDGRVDWLYCVRKDTPKHGGYLLALYLNDLEVVVIEESGGQPRKLLRFIRHIQAATSWCLARQAGRERAAADMLRQRQ